TVPRSVTAPTDVPCRAELGKSCPSVIGRHSFFAALAEFAAFHDMTGRARGWAVLSWSHVVALLPPAPSAPGCGPGVGRHVFPVGRVIAVDVDRLGGIPRRDVGQDWCLGFRLAAWTTRLALSGG